ncbi:unnamed protein product [Amoebophrya sp. A120]|nr:unnamed protein product [Amoebophrya sp. A120]|eukprot:GSA120T00011018001.1
MVMPLGGVTPGGPPSQYCLNTLPKLKILLIGIVFLSCARIVSQSQVEGVIIDGIFDLFTPISGYCLFKDAQTMSSCLCAFMMFAWLSAVNDGIAAIVRFSEYGVDAFCADGNRKIVNDNRIITCTAFQPTYTSVLICITIVQGYTGVLGYKMLKSATVQQAETMGGGLLGADVNAQQAALARELRPGAGGNGNGPLGPRAPAPPSFQAFAGEGQRLG